MLARLAVVAARESPALLTTVSAKRPRSESRPLAKTEGVLLVIGLAEQIPI